MSSHNLDLSGSKKRKRGERVFRFKTFGENGYPVGFVASSFRENVKALLEYGHLESTLCNSASGMKSWSFQLQLHRNAPVHLVLFVVEEPFEASLNSHCKHCQYVGWGKRMVCNKKYHFVLPSTDTMVAAACLVNSKTGGGNNNNYVDTQAGKSSSSLNLVEVEGHNMHGVFHSNGFGHLLCVNGAETGSDLPGHQILEFWDRLCTGLRARKVSLNDVSQKRGMELRLIHGVAYSEPWFGRWGYKFGRGTFCVTQQMYQSAIEALQGIPLCLLIHHLAGITCNQLGHDISLIFSRYHALSDHSLVTLGDLFHFMLELKSRLPTEDQNSCIDSYNPGMLVETSCRWSPKRVEMASRVIVEALKRAHFRWVSRKEVRDAARAYIGDTGLLDFVLKSLGNQIVGNYLVSRSLNPVTKVLEYCLDDLSNVSPNQDGNVMTNSKVKGWYKISRFQLMMDMFYLYKYILKDQNLSTSATTGIFSAIPMAVRIILHSKYLVKDYSGGLPQVKLELGPEGKSNIYCTVMIRNSTQVFDHNKMISSNEIALPPYECITLKNNATINDLKLEVERNFKEIYWGLKSFVVETIANSSMDNANGTDMVFGLVEVGGKIVLEGSNKDMRGGGVGGVGLVRELEGPISECGSGNCIVDCPCGAKDDDGERMVCCDICEVWQHTLLFLARTSVRVFRRFSNIPAPATPFLLPGVIPDLPRRCWNEEEGRRDRDRRSVQQSQSELHDRSWWTSDRDLSGLLLHSNTVGGGLRSSRGEKTVSPTLEWWRNGGNPYGKLIRTSAPDNPCTNIYRYTHH
ncbi:hypothetical protein ACLB2K_033505 [Fragaria x ananassa]